MPLVPIATLLDKQLYAKKNVNGYRGDFVTVRKTFSSGDYIGKIFSWATNTKTGQLYFMVYLTNYDYQNFIPTYFEINDKNLSIPALPEIIKKIEADKKAAEDAAAYNDKGALRYYLDKYLPVVVFGSLAIFALPKLLKSRNG